jgi:hypothetical protein
MKLLIAAICGFIGLTVACGLHNERRAGGALTIFGVDNLSRTGSQSNQLLLNCGKIDLLPRRIRHRAVFS